MTTSHLYEQLPSEVSDEDDFLIYVDTPSPNELDTAITNYFREHFIRGNEFGVYAQVEYERSPYLKYGDAYLGKQPEFFRYETLIAALPLVSKKGNEYFREIAALIYVLVRLDRKFTIVSEHEDIFDHLIAVWKNGGAFEDSR